MKQLLILSGKGGTGKTTVASAFVRLSAAKAYADCDVDAPNLHLVIKHKKNPYISDYYGMKKAEIDINNCIECGLCIANCRFGAISKNYTINIYECEGCGVCEYICPSSAITMKDFKAGDLMLYNDDAVFSTAELKMGSGNSGKLVSEVKKQLRENTKADFAVIDGSPGIGCPVISSISGANMVLIVAEPSVSGVSDMVRIIETARTFKTKIAVCINKYDINEEMCDIIKQYCKNNSIELTGKIPFDIKAVEAINNGVTIVDIDCAAKQAVQEVYNNTIKILNNQE
ncbi:AAA family ATPase [Sedimentibacter hydroxybenzoicus DSM 7310]|uniref:AAA family ATPase n=1 Tax=Sedimentibacter hydroxybenzoicus DSM 7310 TaxID=1123245 RepID=A0A974BMJ8_SEDHY|nr:ATP-binding protein [Sedimentibacter hydroxybenzoicus]NYB75994.1 AAA family ATPase [Sedimentibacter hydroxybenzoicus DSM 7310]